MQMILMQRVLKTMLAAIYLLSPAFMGRIAEYPSFHVFCFDHEQAKPRNNHMIYLGSALRNRQGHILEQVIFPFVEKEPEAEIQKPLPDHPFEPGAFDYRDQQQLGEHKPEFGQQRCQQTGHIHLIPPRLSKPYPALLASPVGWQ